MPIPCSVSHSEQPQWCRTPLCSDPFLPTSPWVEQWFAQRRLPVIHILETMPRASSKSFARAPCTGTTLSGCPGPWSSLRTSKTTRAFLPAVQFCVRRRPDSSLGCHMRVSYAKFRKQLYKETHKEITQIVADLCSWFLKRSPVNRAEWAFCCLYC